MVLVVNGIVVIIVSVIVVVTVVIVVIASVTVILMVVTVIVDVVVAVWFLAGCFGRMPTARAERRGGAFVGSLCFCWL